MPAKVRATCPGCQTVLRIPADWADRPVKCKKCGAVMQGKPAARPAAPSAATVDTAPATPLPGTVPMAQPADPRADRAVGGEPPRAGTVPMAQPADAPGPP